MADRLEVTVQPDLCMGAGYCARLAPGVFGLDPDGVVTTVAPTSGPRAAVPETFHDAALAALRSCPSGAISEDRPSL